MRSLTYRVCTGQPWVVFCACSVVLSTMAVNDGARAQPSGIRVAVLRSTTGEAGGEGVDLAEKADAALLLNLSELAGIKNPTVSPIEYAEIRLTVGCQDQSKDCLAAIAKLLEVDAVVVRVLDLSVPETIKLTLLYFDAASRDEPTTAQIAGQGPDASRIVIDGVPSAVRSLFGIPETVTAAPVEEPVQQPATAAHDQSQPSPPQPPIRPSEQGGVGVWTWMSLIGGGVTLAAGLVVGLSASDAYDDYQQTEITTKSDIERAEVKLDKARSRGTVATVLIPAGSVLLALGGVLLALDLIEGDSREPSVVPTARVTYQPLDRGGLVRLDGRWNPPW